MKVNNHLYRHFGDRYYGLWKGRQVSFKDTWANHFFTDNEVIQLFNGEIIKLEYINSNKEISHTRGCLGYSEYKEKKYFGFVPEFADDFPQKNELKFDNPSNSYNSKLNNNSSHGIRDAYQGETLLGMDDNGNPISIGTNTWETKINNNLLVLGPSGAGKTRYVLKPNLLQMGSSYIVLDTKGTLKKEVGDVLQKYGYEIQVLDFSHDMRGNVGYDPLKFVRREDYKSLVGEGINYRANEQDVLTIAKAICPKTNSKDPFWDNAAALVLSALIHAAIEEKGSAASFVDVIRFYENCYDGEDNKIKEINNFSEPDVEKLNQIKSQNCFDFSTAYRDILKIQKKTESSTAYKIINRAKNMGVADRMWASILGILEGHLMTFISGEASQMYLNEKQINFRLLASKKIALFVTISDHDQSIRPITNLFITQAFSSLIDYADEQQNGMLPMPVRMYLDDFSNLNINDMANIMSIIRSREIWVTILCQSTSQLDENYGFHNAESIVANCDTQLILGFCDNSTANSYSLRARKQSVSLLETPLDKSWVFVRGRKGECINHYDLSKHPLYFELGEEPRTVK